MILQPYLIVHILHNSHRDNAGFVDSFELLVIKDPHIYLEVTSGMHMLKLFL